MSENLANKISVRTGIKPEKIAEIVQLALEELHRLSIVGSQGPADAAMEACFSFGGEAAFHFIGILAVDNAYAGRENEAAMWNGVAMRFVPAAYREGAERIAPWFHER